MAFTVKSIPDRIAAEVVRSVVDQIIEYMNERSFDETLLTVKDVIRVEILPEQVHVARVRPTVYGESYWGGAFVSDSRYGSTENALTPTVVAWTEALGIDPHSCMSVTIYGRYVQVVVHHQGDGVKTLRRDGEGYMKHTIDIPIYQENSRG